MKTIVSWAAKPYSNYYIRPLSCNTLIVSLIEPFKSFKGTRSKHPGPTPTVAAGTPCPASGVGARSRQEMLPGPGWVFSRNPKVRNLIASILKSNV